MSGDLTREVWEFGSVLGRQPGRGYTRGRCSPTLIDVLPSGRPFSRLIRQTGLKPLKISEKVQVQFYDPFRTKKLARTGRSQPCSTVTFFDSLFLGKYKRWRLQILTLFLNRYLWLFENYALFRNLTISVIYSSFFIITFDWKRNFEFTWIQRKDLVQIYQNIPYFKL